MTSRVSSGVLLRWWLVAGVVLAWYGVASWAGLSPIVLPGPGQVIEAFAREPAGYLSQLGLTLSTSAIGLVGGVALGYGMAALAWLVPFLGGLLTPLALVIRSVPFVALIPVLARVFGYGVPTAWVICGLVCFFPTFVLVSSGFREVPPDSDDLFTVLGSSRWDRFLRLAVPSAMPALATSVRISASTSILAALVAEYLMGVPGLARVLADALDRLEVDRMWAAAGTATVLAVAIFTVTTKLESRVQEGYR